MRPPGRRRGEGGGARPPAPVDGRARYLRQVVNLLYPGRDGPSREYLVLPHPRRPRLLAPAASRRSAAAAVRRYALPRSRSSALLRQLAAAALLTGGHRLLPYRLRVFLPGSIEEYLREVLGDPPQVSLYIGPDRANRKPVLHLMHPLGETAGFAKVGTSALTRTLVRAEAAALATLARAGLRRVTVPWIRHYGSWRGHEVLVQCPLPVWLRRAPAAPERLAAAMWEVAGCRGVGEGALRGAPYWRRLWDRVGRLRHHAGRDVLAGALRGLAEHAGDRELRYGAWHGDWSPWNMATLPDTVLLWDWERFETGVPLGFDALHLHLQRELAAGRDPIAAAEATVAAAGRVLAPFQVPPAGAEVTALLYLAELATRYLADGQAAAGARLGSVDQWLLPVLTDRSARLR